MSPDLKDLYRYLDRMSKYGEPTEQDLMAHLVHEIDDYIGRGDKKCQDSTRGSQATPSQT